MDTTIKAAMIVAVGLILAAAVTDLPYWHCMASGYAAAHCIAPLTSKSPAD